MIILSILVLLPRHAVAEESLVKTALLLVDIQNFYFPGGRSELVGPEAASLNAANLLEKFRDADGLVVHVRHDSEPGGEIHENVRPRKGEKVITKDDINSFKGTDLLDILRDRGIEKLVIAGMMTHMCVEAATRAAHDLGFACVVVGDACATRALEFGGVAISAEAVHHSTLATLSGYYAEVIDTDTFLKEY